MEPTDAGKQADSMLIKGGDNNNADQDERNKKQTKRNCFANIWVFVFLMCMATLIQMMIAVYTVGMNRTLEKRYGLSSAQSNSFLSFPNISYLVLVLFVSHLGRNSHRPRVIAVCCFFFFLGCCVVVSPHFLLKSNDDETTNGPEDLEAMDVPLQSKMNMSDVLMYSHLNSHTSRNEHMCIRQHDDTHSTSPSSHGCSERSGNSNRNAYYVMLAGFIITGLGDAAIKPLGISYLDDNIAKNKVAFAIGLYKQFLE